MHCRRCEYDLTGLPAGACPECGRPFDPADERSFAAHPGAAPRGLKVLIGVLAALAIVLPGRAAVTHAAPLLIVMAAMAPGILGLVMAIGGIGLQERRLPRPAVLASLMPAVISLTLFYTLVIHMWLALGGWPTSIGTRGFPPELVWHADFAVGSFSALLAFNLFVWWWIAIVCASVPAWRRAVLPLGLHGLACAAAFGLMLMAPDPFLYWWWD